MNVSTDCLLDCATLPAPDAGGWVRACCCCGWRNDAVEAGRTGRTVLALVEVLEDGAMDIGAAERGTLCSGIV